MVPFAVFKTVVSRCQGVGGGFDSHALPPVCRLKERAMIKRGAILALSLLAGAALGTAYGEAPSSRDFDFTYTARIGELPAGAPPADPPLPHPPRAGHHEGPVARVAAPDTPTGA